MWPRKGKKVLPRSGGESIVFTKLGAGRGLFDNDVAGSSRISVRRKLDDEKNIYNEPSSTADVGRSDGAMCSSFILEGTPESKIGHIAVIIASSLRSSLS